MLADPADDLEIDDHADGAAESAERSVASPQPVAETPKPVVVEVEINRLSSIPDLIDDDSPIELPPITPSGSVIAAPQHLLAGACRVLLRTGAAAPPDSGRAHDRGRGQTEAPQAPASQEEAPPVQNVHDLGCPSWTLGRRRIRRQEVPPSSGELVRRIEAAGRWCRDRARSWPRRSIAARWAFPTVDSSRNSRYGSSRPARRAPRSACPDSGLSPSQGVKSASARSELATEPIATIAGVSRSEIASSTRS